MELMNLTALSPLDGRYADKVPELRDYLSEYALIRYRVLIEVRWLQHLADEGQVGDLAPFDSPTKDLLNGIVDRFSIEDARRVKALEQTTNHDVKAVEYYLRERLSGIPDPSKNVEAFLHFACTSEDINNLSYALMLRDARSRVIVPALKDINEFLRSLAQEHAGLAMLSRTHGQAASPTTLGKEIANVVHRLERQLAHLTGVEILGKMNGAVGNFNAHTAAYPDCDWPAVSARFVESLGLSPQFFTTQIEPHDWIAELSHALIRCNTVLIDLSRDIWGYVSLGYFKSRPVANEVGSSTMPHKVNPIDFENAEGNLGIANALLEHFAAKLPISRWQRDLTDSTVLRNAGPALGHSVVAYRSALKGLTKLDVAPDRISADLDASWEVLAEAIQTVMRARGIPDAYEQLKQLTRGRSITEAVLREFVDAQSLPSEDRHRLRAMKPRDYVGLAEKMTRAL